MHASTLQSILEHLRKLTDPARVRDLSDADLLERFRLHREEAAFTLLVQRHGRWFLPSAAASSAMPTILVLVRNATAIRKQQSVAGWLRIRLR